MDEFSNATFWLVSHCDVLESVDKLRAEKRENALNHVLVAVVLFVIVGSTIKLLVPGVITMLSQMAQRSNPAFSKPANRKSLSRLPK